MGILGSFSRYLRTHGRLLYADPRGFGTTSAFRRRKKSARAAYLEYLEPRVLMTTVYGGEVFQYTDSLGNLVKTTLNGNVVTELVSAVQAGGISPKRLTSHGGYLIFGDIAGRFTSGPRQGVVVGNGSLPVNNGTQGSATASGAHITVPNAAYPAGLTGATQVYLQTLATNNLGQTFTFNLFDNDTAGNVMRSPLDAGSQQQQWVMQLIELNNSTMAGSVVYSVNSDSSVSPLHFPTDNTTSTYAYANVGVKAAAFNPIDNRLYFEFHYDLAITTGSNGTAGSGTNGTGSTTTSATSGTFDDIYVIDTRQGQSGSFRLVGSIDTTRNAAGAPRQEVTGMAFVVNATAPTTATMYLSMQPNGVGGPPTLRPPPSPQLVPYAVSSSGSISLSSPQTPMIIYEGYGAGRSPLTDIVGLTSLPASQDGGGSGYLFALVSNASNGASSHLARIELVASNGSTNATSWGNTTDVYETIAHNAAAPYDGQSMTGLTYNPTLVDPFTGQLGTFMSIDTATTNLDFINHKLRVNAGDVYSVYTTVSDINSSIVFQGTNLYQGDSGAVGKNGSPGNTGTVYIGFKGQMPDDSTNDTYASSLYITGQITDSIGVMPGLIRTRPSRRIRLWPPTSCSPAWMSPGRCSRHSIPP